MAKSTQKLNLSAKDLVTQLPDHIAEILVGFCDELKIPLWQYVDGLLLDSYYTGRLGAFQLDPSWKDGFRGENYTCKQCQAEFSARRIGQVFCCQECAEAYAKQEYQNAHPDSTDDVSNRDDSLKDHPMDDSGSLSDELRKVLNHDNDVSTDTESGVRPLDPGLDTDAERTQNEQPGFDL